MKTSLSVSTTFIVTVVILFSTVGSVIAKENSIAPGGNVPTARPHQQNPTDRAELEAFLAELLGKEMKEHHIAGAAVAVVKDGKLFFAKGYGYADIEKGLPVNPEQTIFRIGSVTKLFTWTAVMQLVEQGKLELEADVNTYLDFRIPDTYPRPITLKHLMTHTAGFEDLYVDFASLEEENQLQAAAFLASHIPGRVRPPGEQSAYSNYGAALAGYIVARVSGLSYDQYIQENIFDPLDMAHSAALATLHPDVAARQSVGYVYQDGTLQVFPRFYGPRDLAPMGYMASSATDMARFMIAHLQGGRYSDESIPEARILQGTTAQRMHTTLYTSDPRLLGTAYGFFDFSDNGQRTIGHNGEAEPMSSLLLLLPDQDLGVFVAYNTLGSAWLTTQHLGFQRAFFDHYFPAAQVDPIQPPADFAERAGRFVGGYRMARSAYTTLEKLMVMLGALNVEVKDPGDNTLVLATPWGDWRFVEEEPLFFRKVDGPFHIVFREDDRGRITNLYTDYTPQFGFEKLNWHETPAFSMALFLGCTLIFLSLILVALVRLIWSRRRGGERKLSPRSARLADWIILGICVLNVLFVVGSFLWNNPRPSFGVSMAFEVVLGLGVLSTLLTVGALVSTVLAWKNGYWGVAARAYYTLVTVAAVSFVWFLNYWNLLGWRF